MEYIMNNVITIVWAIITTCALGACKGMYGKLKDYKVIIDDKENEAIVELIHENLKPIVTAIEELSESVKDSQTDSVKNMETLRELHKFELIRLCISYLGYGFMTMEEYNYLVDFYDLYKELGGNGQGDAYYKKAIELPIKERHWKDDPKQG